jgi:outer membrane lipoprotein-sorting protein
MKVTFLLSFLLLLSICIYSQKDLKATDILDKVASKNNSYKTIKVDYKFTSQDDQSHNESGKILIKGEKYHLTLSNSDIVFDGKSIYTYLKEANEINITKPEPSKVENGEFFFSNPRDIFKGYNKNFKSSFIKETNINNSICYEIDLIPIDLKTKYTRLKMTIQKTSYQIQNIRLFLKDGTQFLLELSNFTPNAELTDKEFVFDLKKHPDAEVNDMRF